MLFLPIIYLLVPWFLAAQFNPFERRKVNEIQFKGNVREVEFTEVIFEISDGKLSERGERIRQKAFFDTSGYVYKSVMYSLDGSIFYTVKTTILKKDRSQWVDSTFDANGRFYGRTNMSYIKSTREYSYKYYTKNGDLTSMYYAKFDSQNRKIDVKNGLPNKSSYEVSKITYSIDGLLSTQRDYNVYGKLIGTTQSFYNPDGKLAQTEYTAIGEKVKFLVDYNYNTHGFESSQFRRKSDNSFKVIWEFLYSYDLTGNIIKKISSKNGNVDHIKKFRILYY